MSFAQQIIDDELRSGRTSRVTIETVRAGTSEGERQLVLFIHGAGGGRKVQIARFMEFANRELQGAELASIEYHPAFSMSASPFQLTSDLQVELVRYVHERREQGSEFDRITIVCYSAGALLARKAVVWMHDRAEDHPDPERCRRMVLAWREIYPEGVPMRLVLLAGMTRGWSLEWGSVGSPSSNFFTQFVLTIGVRIVQQVAGLFRLLRYFIPIWTHSYPGRFLLDLERGSAFVADLRIQWLYVKRDESLEVVQVLGLQDPLVAVGDHNDVACDNFVLMTTPYLDHSTIFLLTETGDLLPQCVTGPLEKLRERLEYNEVEVPEVGDAGVVFIMHGIRDNSDWCRELAQMIETSSSRSRPFHCVTSSYGHFPMLGFLSKVRRLRNVRWFMDRYAETLSLRPHLLPDANDGEFPVHFVGHSNGTYLLAAGLRAYASLRVNRAVFMGSVVPRDFEWDRIAATDRIRELRNDRGSSDWVVGWFPTFYQIIRNLSWRVFRRPETNDIGNGGFRGFDRSVARHHENYYFPGGHDAMINRDNLLSIARYLVTGNGVETPCRLLRRPNGFVSIVSRLCWLLWIVLTAIIFGGAVLLGIYVAGPWGCGDFAGLAAGLGWIVLWAMILETA